MVDDYRQPVRTKKVHEVLARDAAERRLGEARLERLAMVRLDRAERRALHGRELAVTRAVLTSAPAADAEALLIAYQELAEQQRARALAATVQLLDAYMALRARCAGLSPVGV